MTLPAAYDAHADWYEDFIGGPAKAYTERIRQILADLLGAGTGSCLDVACGTGAHAQTIRTLGWTPLGADLSAAQLRHAVRRLPVVHADATALPVPGDSVPAAVCVLAHTDVPDYAAVLGEVARVLRPGGRFVHVGVHPCFVGAFADWGDPPRVILDGRYADRSLSFDSWSPAGVRARIGAWHVPLADLVNGVIAAGLRVDRIVEGAANTVPDILGLLATKPTGLSVHSRHKGRTVIGYADSGLRG